MSAAARPPRTATPLIGSERSRFVIPRPASFVTALIVDSRPNSMASANIPGIR